VLQHRRQQSSLGKRSNNVLRGMVYFSLFYNDMCWTVGDKGTKGIKDGKTEGER
jgi:hypothetical protein